jgi:hypothetical protein
MSEFAFRFLVGGLVVSIFAALGDVLKPKSFAGLFGAAPSVALATLALTLTKSHGDVVIEARSMIAGAAAFFLYAAVCTHVLMKHCWPTLRVASAALGVWFAFAGFLFFAWLQ